MSFSPPFKVFAVLVTLCLAQPLTTPALFAAPPDYVRSYELERREKYNAAIVAMGTPSGGSDYFYNIRMGWLHHLDGQSIPSISYYQAAVREAPASLEARTGLMLPLLAQKRFAEVETMALQLVRQDPTNYLANLRLAFSLRNQLKFEKALMIDTYMLRLYPADLKFRLEHALALTGLKRYPEARASFQRALDLDPENEVARYWLDQLY